MDAAGLKFDQNGQAAWNEIWADFCDLALAGGSPHRGTLLEPAIGEEILAQPEKYQDVLFELQRGLEMVTGWPVVRSENPGWIGLQCNSEEMALWLLRAIVVENVTVRREGTILYLPAGLDFKLEKEIKNVITVVAKTHHYWQEHLQSTEPQEVQNSIACTTIIARLSCFALIPFLVLSLLSACAVPQADITPVPATLEELDGLQLIDNGFYILFDTTGGQPNGGKIVYRMLQKARNWHNTGSLIQKNLISRHSGQKPFIIQA